MGPQESPPEVKDLRQSHRPNPLKQLRKLLARGTARLEKWRDRRAAVQAGQAEAPQVTLDGVSFEAFGSEVRRVLRPWDLRDSELLTPQPLLHPEVGRGEVADFAKALALGDANGRSRVAPQHQAR